MEYIIGLPQTLSYYICLLKVLCVSVLPRLNQKDLKEISSTSLTGSLLAFELSLFL